MNIVGWFRFFRNARGVWNYLHDETVGRWHKRGVVALVVLTAIYVVSPLDIIPDFLAPAILFVAFLDDIGFMALCFVVLNQIGMRYAETHQLPAAPAQKPLSSPEAPDLPAGSSPLPTP